MKNEVDYQAEYERFAQADAREAELHQRLHGEYDGQYHESAPQSFSISGSGISYRRPVSDATLVFRIIAIVFLCVGLLIGGVYFVVIHFMNEKYDRCTAETTATVFDNIINENTYTPVFLYEVDGQSYKMKSSYSTNPPKYRINEKVTLYYNPDKPEEFYVDKASTLVTYILVGLASLFTLMGIVFGIVSVNAKDKKV